MERNPRLPGMEADHSRHNSGNRSRRLKKVEAEKLSRSARQFEQYLTSAEPKGDAAGEASILAQMLERFAAGLSTLQPVDADKIFASRIRKTLNVARASGVPVSWDLSKWGRTAYLLELSAYCEEQATALSSAEPLYSNSLHSQAEQYRSAAISLLG
jgi:hypothetical protein